MRVLLVLLAALILIGCSPSGDGWRQLYSGEGVDEASLYNWHGGVAAALDDSSYAALWSATGATQDRPAIDFDRDIVALFAKDHQRDCPLALTGVKFSRSQTTRVSIEDKGVEQVCGLMIAPAWVYVIALSRSKIDTPTIQLAPPAGVHLEDLTVDLGAPGLYSVPLPTERPCDRC